jgi:branched-chain amino acid transport system substrate-binding protein
MENVVPAFRQPRSPFMAAAQHSRRNVLGLIGLSSAVGAVSLTGCGGGSIGGATSATGASGPAGGGAIKVGLVIPQSGVYTPLGVDMQNGWKLWLDQHGGKIGGRTVQTITGDEGDGPKTGVPAVQGLLQRDQVDVLVGLVNSATALGVVDQITEAKKLLVISNAGANAITAGARNPYIWRTSFTNGQVAAAMGQHLAKQGVKGGVYVLASDYAAGKEAAAGFVDAFKAGGGTIAGQALTPFGTTQDYQPFLSAIPATGAGATFVFYAGSEAVSFVQQYTSFGLARTTPLYGSGFLTEGGVLKAQGAAAVGVQTSLHYSTEVKNAANTAFVKAYTDAFQVPPTVYAVQTYDAAAALDKAVAKSADLSGTALSGALGQLGDITDSPRGPWKFAGQTPEQVFYLRKVQASGAANVNAVVSEIGTFGQQSS